jgi:hypothetical protein
MAIKKWQNVHPLLKNIPVQWDHDIPFGLLHSPNPSPKVLSFIRAVERVYKLGK